MHQMLRQRLSADISQKCPSPQRQLNLSTIIQPGNTDSYWVPPADQQWGLVSLDWSVARGVWFDAKVIASRSRLILVHQVVD